LAHTTSVLPEKQELDLSRLGNLRLPKSTGAVFYRFRNNLRAVLPMETTSVALAPPSDISRQHVSDLLKDLDFGGRPVEILGYKKPGVVFNDGGGSGGVQLLQWMLTITQTGAWEWMAAFLTGYAGKEFLKGFAGEAGKDFWKAIKIFASRISGDDQLESKSKQQIEISTKDNSGKPSFSVKIDPSWFGSEEHRRMVGVLEDVVLPSLARFLDSSGRQESNQPEILDVYIRPLRKKRLGWELRVLRRASPWEIEVRFHGTPMEIEWDTRDGTLDWRSAALINEFSVDGGHTARQVNIFTRP
jgi:hypothetical protein